MPRPAKVWKRGQNGCYYAKIDGVQERLSEDYKEAVEMFHRLKTAARKRKRGKKSGKLLATLGEVSDGFLDLAEKTKSPKTYENQKAYLQSFCDHAGKGTRVGDLTGERLDAWSLAQPWGESTRAAARATVLACLRWGVEAGRLLDNPLEGSRRGRYERRERILKPEEKEKVRGAVKGGLKDFLFFLEMTGCRPFSEAATVTAAMIDWEDGSITFEKHKNRKKGKARVIYLPPPLLARLRELAEQRPFGPLLLTQLKNPWNRPAAAKAMRRIEEKTGVPRLTVYAWRHTYITDCLAKGMSASIVAELVGNSVRTITRYYNHLDQHKDALRDAAHRAVR